MVNVFIGSIIRQKVKERKLTVSEFAKSINRSRTTVYDIFNRKSIDVDLLLTISKALDFDFLSEIYLVKKDNSAKKCYLAIEIDPSELPCDAKEVAEADKLKIRVLLKEKLRSIIEQENKRKSVKKR
ncbi:MAG: helix-turn-helix transcriptional regulator [Bacteroidales bacterium]|nr:helix-turn-helix transcriptional regulator [Bacteroidales bacterium]